MDLGTAMRTTPASRDFTDDPISDDVLFGILDVARFAPSGGNRQAWRVIVLKDPAIRARIRELYVLSWREYMAHEPAVKQLLGIPDGHALAGLIALGRPARTVTKLRRSAVSDFTNVDTFSGPPFP